MTGANTKHDIKPLPHDDWVEYKADIKPLSHDDWGEY
jgi:hypothetical protein